MKLLNVVCLLATAASLYAQGKQPKPAPPSPPEPPPVLSAQPAPVPAPAEKFVYEQKPMAGRPVLVTSEQAQTIINRFKEAYPKMGNPRILIYVNRELVDEESGLKLSARSEQTEAVRGDIKREARADEKAASPSSNVPTGERVTNKNTYRVRDPKQAALADKQTVRDVERLFGRPLRLGGATLVDQRTATQLIPGKKLENFVVHTEGEQARKDREVLAKIADVVLEILISSRNLTASEISGERVYSVPDIQATAIRLSDAKILGQAAASELIGQNPPAKVVRNIGVRDITEATALSLMEDMLQ
ncbi:MAG: hypothetical protein FJ403_08295 [Verrucomicrobia bacterium]|nr:hypothetical protein [Verrucomicrobiota bacterium]